MVEEDYVGKGVFLSEYVSESEVFLGRVLQQIIKGRGKLDDEGSSYFTPYAKRQMKEADWELLEEDWVCHPYDYFRDYSITYPYGEPHYRFSYTFFTDLNKMEEIGGEAKEIQVSLLVNGEGVIYHIDFKIEKVSIEKTGTAYYIYTTPLCNDLYKETIIENGERREGLLFDFEPYFRRGRNPKEAYVEELRGFFRDGDMAVGGEK